MSFWSFLGITRACPTLAIVSGRGPTESRMLKLKCYSAQKNTTPDDVFLVFFGNYARLSYPRGCQQPRFYRTSYAKINMHLSPKKYHAR